MVLASSEVGGTFEVCQVIAHIWSDKSLPGPPSTGMMGSALGLVLGTGSFGGGCGIPHRVHSPPPRV